MTRSRIVAALCALFVVLLGAPSFAGTSISPTTLIREVDAGGRIPARFITDHGSVRLAKASDPLDAAQLRSISRSFQFGYSAGLVGRHGTRVTAIVGYVDQKAPNTMLMVSRAGVVQGDAVVFGSLDASYATWTNSLLTVRRVVDGNSIVTVRPLTLDASAACVIDLIFTVVDVGLCVAGDDLSCLQAGIDGGAAAGDCTAGLTADLEPKNQTVSGTNDSNGEVDFDLTGSSDVAADRDLVVPFNTCGSCPYRRYWPNGKGTTYHFYTPLSCSTTQTETGTIEYKTGYAYSSAKVTVRNTSC
jgi:hypothetical protein